MCQIVHIQKFVEEDDTACDKLSQTVQATDEELLIN